MSPFPFLKWGMKMAVMRSDAVLFDETILPGETRTIEKKLSFRGVLKQMTITNYPGQQKTLKVNPYMLKAPDLFVSLAKFAGDRKYFSGDETTYEISMNIPFGSQDRLVVDVTNESAYPYDLYVLFEVEYGGAI